MTQEMEILYHKLVTVKTQSVKAAYRHVRAELEMLDLDGRIDIDVSEKGLRKMNKPLRKLNKIYKGRSQESAHNVYDSYPVDSTEYFVLKCVVNIMENSRKPSIF